ncbi:response regulator, partial [Pseudodesulfovibrio pelocollis]|uniref:response regulator n=1 Tax=Pseudodesulfovibrio pelocollis TaxID=3051432 RepID=UPI00255B0A5F
GEGTTFHFCLTFDRVQSEPEKATEAPQSDGRGIKNYHVLLAEDEKVNQIAVRRLLEKYGHRVTVAENGKRALEALNDDSFDIIFMDVQMPVMDGVAATRAIRRGDAGMKNASIPIVALTAYAMVGDRERFLEAGMDNYLTKPVEIDELLELLGRLSGT